MPPTVQTGSSPADRNKQRPGEKKSDLVCRVKYCNTLPDIPFDPKFITYPFESNRFVQYKPTSLERNYKYDLLTEHDLGVTIDLINPDIYAPVPQLLDAEDERLLEEDSLQPQDSKRSRHHKKIVPWLKKTEYISTEFNRYGSSSEKTETKVGYNVKKLFKDDHLYMDRESQISAIDKTFEDVKKPLEKHYSKPGVTPVEVHQVLPDFDLWKYPFAQVMFDSDPASMNEIDEMSQAMIRGVMDESGEQFVAYFLPTEDTLKKRKRDEENQVEYLDEEVYEYKMAREYNWNVKNKASKGYEENYFFVFRKDAVYYNELETRVRLSKRRVKPGMQPNNSRLVVCHRPLNEAENRTQEVRLTQLDPPQEEEEEEEEEAEAENEKMDEDKGEDGDEVAADEEAESEAESAKDDGEEQQQQQQSDEEEAGNAKSSSSSSSGSSSSASSASSESSGEEEEGEDAQKRRDEEEIFGSDSD